MSSEQNLLLQALVSLIPAVIVAVGAYLGVRHTTHMQERAVVLTRDEEAEQVLRRYRDPLVRAAFDLQSRVYNIAVNDFLAKYLTRGTDDERAYARESTLYVIGQYFGWIEIMRREVQFLDLREVSRNRELAEKLDAVTDAFLSERADSAFRVLRGEQRAIGEVMTVDRSVSRSECLGYAVFTERLNDPAFMRWFAKLSGDLAVLAERGDPRHPRLVDAQHALIDLIEFLDPDEQYFAGHRRGKIPAND